MTLPAWTTEDFCYLCGKELSDRNRDHVPPRRIFPTAVRAGVRGGLLTLKTHPACQKQFQSDEEYFFTTLLPNALTSPVGKQLADDFQHLLRRDSPSRKLAATVHRQFEERPSGLVLPNGKMIQRIDGARIYNIVWKISRGLFSQRFQRFLSANGTRAILMHSRLDDDVPEPIHHMLRHPPEGHTINCFSYAFSSTTEEVENWDQGFAHVLLINVWETYLFYVLFHDPGCDCEKCYGPDRT